MTNQVAIPTSITDLIEVRNAAVKRIDSIFEIFEGGEELCKEHDISFAYGITGRDKKDHYIKKLDESFWRKSFAKAGFYKVMDAQAVDEFWKSMEVDVPAFNMENIRATVINFLSQSEMIFKRGLVNVFESLSGNYHSHNSFKIKKKMIISGCVGSRGYVEYNMGVKFNDMDRVICHLLSVEHVDSKLTDGISEAWRSGNDYEDRNIIVKGFSGNGNAHLIFKEQGLINKINDLIAEYYNENELACD